MGTFYRYLPDLSIAEVMFTTGFTIAVLGALGLSGAFGAEGIAWRPASPLDPAVGGCRGSPPC